MSASTRPPSSTRDGFLSVATPISADKAVEHLGFSDGVHSAPGILFHWVEATDNGFVVHDVWESEDQFNTFVAERLVPMAAELGMAEPKAEVTAVDNHLHP